MYRNPLSANIYVFEKNVVNRSYMVSLMDFHCDLERSLRDYYKILQYTFKLEVFRLQMAKDGVSI